MLIFIAITNYQKNRSLEQTQILPQESSLQGCSQNAGRAEFSSEYLIEEWSVSNLTQCFGKIHLLVTISLTALASC